MSTKYYIGYDEDGIGEVFASDDPTDALPEYSGYETVSQPFDTQQEANDNNY